MDYSSSSKQPQSSSQIYRKIKQRSTNQNEPGQNYKQPSQLRSHHNQHHQNNSRKWFTQNSPSKYSGVNSTEPQKQPVMKILAKSSTNERKSSNNTENNSESSIKPAAESSSQSSSQQYRPSVAILEKNIQQLLNIHTSSSQHPSQSPQSSTPVDNRSRRESATPLTTTKTIKLIDFEFNFVASLTESPLIDSILMPDLSVQNSSLSSQISSSVGPGFALTNSGTSNQVSSSSNQHFCIVAAVGLDGTGKSSLLNSIAQREAFETRLSKLNNKSTSNGQQCLENPLSHVTNGIDLHITSERVFLLDTQPLLSASVLDELMRRNVEQNSGTNCSNSTTATGINSKHFYNSLLSTPIFSQVVGFDIAETENFAFMYSLQMLTFLITVCDHVILVLDSLSLDGHLFKLLSTAMMMVGDAVVTRANIIIYLRTETCTNKKNNYKKKSFNFNDQNDDHLKNMFIRTLKIMLGPTCQVDFIANNEQQLMATVLRPSQSRLLMNMEQQCSTISYQSERIWFHSVQRFWDSSIHRSSLFSDYARHLP